MAVIDANRLQNNEKLNLEIKLGIRNIPSKNKSGFQHEFCG